MKIFTAEEYSQLARALLDRIERLKGTEQTSSRGEYKALLEKVATLRQKIPNKETWNGTLSDLYGVGIKKPLGYLTEAQIRESGSSIKKVKVWAKDKGFLTMQFSKGTRGHTSSVLYVFDANALSRFLLKKRSILVRAGWPTTPKEFVAKVATVQASPHSIVCSHCWIFCRQHELLCSPWKTVAF